MVPPAVFFLALAFFVLPGTILAQSTGVPPGSGGPAAPAGGSNLAGWNIEYQMPQGWRVVQSLGRLQMLGSDTEAGAIFIAPGLYASANESIADLTLFYQSMNLIGYPTEPPSETTIAGLKAVVATIASQDQMMRPVHGRFIGMLTTHGTGLNMLAMTTPDKFHALRATLERLATTVKAKPPSINRQAIATLGGTWMLYSGGHSGGSSVTGSTSGSHEETVAFDGQGGFQYHSSSSVTVYTPGSGGSYGGGAGSAGSDSDQGTYTVIDRTLVLKGTKGQLAVDIQLQGDKLVAGGKTYLRSR
jgi:hypothetical protein